MSCGSLGAGGGHRIPPLQVSRRASLPGLIRTVDSTGCVLTSCRRLRVGWILVRVGRCSSDELGLSPPPPHFFRQQQEGCSLLSCGMEEVALLMKACPKRMPAVCPKRYAAVPRAACVRRFSCPGFRTFREEYVLLSRRDSKSRLWLCGIDDQ